MVKEESKFEKNPLFFAE